MDSKAALLPLHDPKSPEFTKLLHGSKKDSTIFIGIESLHLLASFIVLVFVMTATIVLSAMTFCEKSLTFMDLRLGVGKSWKRPLVTCFNTTIFGSVFIFGSTVLMVTFILNFYRPIAFVPILGILGVLGSGFLFYLSFVWVLAVVVLVLEENCYGIQAIGKAGDLVKGKRLDGFVLCLVFGLCNMIEIPVFGMMVFERSLSARIIMGLLVIICNCLISMFQIINFTVFYFHCKKYHGEEIELRGSVAYSKLATTLLFKEDIP